jgi:hypothetical protein
MLAAAFGRLRFIWFKYEIPVQSVNVYTLPWPICCVFSILSEFPCFYSSLNDLVAWPHCILLTAGCPKASHSAINAHYFFSEFHREYE